MLCVCEHARLEYNRVSIECTFLPPKPGLTSIQVLLDNQTIPTVFSILGKSVELVSYMYFFTRSDERFSYLSVLEIFLPASWS